MDRPPQPDTLTTPVLLIAFNRPKLTEQVLDAIVAAGTRHLYVAIDGPRPDRPEDVAAVDAVATLLEAIPAAIDVRVLRRSHNLGCGKAVASALDWFFQAEPEGIVLEDDCLPSATFFTFCAAMLHQYRDDERVWMVTGLNQLDEWRNEEGEYFFSDGGIWGWATWRDRWRMYDQTMADWALASARERVRSLVGHSWWSVLEEGFRLTAAGVIDTWDYQWTWTRLLNGGLSVIPVQNLVTNVGTGASATHGGEPDAFVHTHRHDLYGPFAAVGGVEIDRDYLDRLSRRVRRNRQRIRRRARVRYYRSRLSGIRNRRR